MGVIQRQSIKNFFTSYVGVLIGFVNVLIIQPRFLTAEELGLTRILYSFALLVSTFIPMGVGNIAIKFFPQFRAPERKHHGFFGFLLAGTLIGFVISATFIFLFRNFFIGQYLEKSKLFTDFFYWIFPLSLFIAFITQLNIYCYSLYKSTVPSFLNDIISRLGVIVLISLYFLNFFSLHTFISLFVLIYGFQALLLFVYIFYEERPGFKIDFQQFKNVGWRPILNYGIIIWVASIASMGLKELATIFLGTRVTLDNVAVYVVASFIPTLIEVPLNALDKIATYNITTALAQNNMKIVDEIYKKSARYMLLIGGLLFLLINANIHSLLNFLPEKYRGGDFIILILSCGTLFNMATGLNSQILVYSSKYYYGAVMLIAAVIVNFSLQLVLIPHFGIAGAAIATAFAGIFMNFCNSIIVWKHYRLNPVERRSFTALGFIILVAVADYFIPHMLNLYLDIILHSTFITTVFLIWIINKNLIPELNLFLKRTSS